MNGPIDERTRYTDEEKSKIISFYTYKEILPKNLDIIYPSTSQTSPNYLKKNAIYLAFFNLDTRFHFRKLISRPLEELNEICKGNFPEEIEKVINKKKIRPDEVKIAADKVRRIITLALNV